MIGVAPLSDITFDPELQLMRLISNLFTLTTNSQSLELNHRALEGLRELLGTLKSPIIKINFNEEVKGAPIISWLLFAGLLESSFNEHLRLAAMPAIKWQQTASEGPLKGVTPLWLLINATQRWRCEEHLTALSMVFEYHSFDSIVPVTQAAGKRVPELNQSLDWVMARHWQFLLSFNKVKTIVSRIFASNLSVDKTAQFEEELNYHLADVENLAKQAFNLGLKRAPLLMVKLYSDIARPEQLHQWLAQIPATSSMRDEGHLSLAHHYHQVNNHKKSLVCLYKIAPESAHYSQAQLLIVDVLRFQLPLGKEIERDLNSYRLAIFKALSRILELDNPYAQELRSQLAFNYLSSSKEKHSNTLINASPSLTNEPLIEYLDGSKNFCFNVLEFMSQPKKLSLNFGLPPSSEPCLPAETIAVGAQPMFRSFAVNPTNQKKLINLMQKFVNAHHSSKLESEVAAEIKDFLYSVNYYELDFNVDISLKEPFKRRAERYFKGKLNSLLNRTAFTVPQLYAKYSLLLWLTWRLTYGSVDTRWEILQLITDHPQLNWQPDLTKVGSFEMLIQAVANHNYGWDILEKISLANNIEWGALPETPGACFSLLATLIINSLYDSSRSIFRKPNERPALLTFVSKMMAKGKIKDIEMRMLYQQSSNFSVGETQVVQQFIWLLLEKINDAFLQKGSVASFYFLDHEEYPLSPLSSAKWQLWKQFISMYLEVQNNDEHYMVNPEQQVTLERAAEQADERGYEYAWYLLFKIFVTLEDAAQCEVYLAKIPRTNRVFIDATCELVALYQKKGDLENFKKHAANIPPSYRGSPLTLSIYPERIFGYKATRLYIIMRELKDLPNFIAHNKEHNNKIREKLLDYLAEISDLNHEAAQTLRTAIANKHVNGKKADALAHSIKENPLFSDLKGSPILCTRLLELMRARAKQINKHAKTLPDEVVSSSKLTS